MIKKFNKKYKMPRRDMPPIYDVLFQTLPKQEIMIDHLPGDSSQEDSCSSPEIVQNQPLYSPTMSFKFITSQLEENHKRKPVAPPDPKEELLDDYVDDFMSDFVDIFVDKFLDSVVEEKANDIFNEHMFDMIIDSKHNS